MPGACWSFSIPTMVRRWGINPRVIDQSEMLHMKARTWFGFALINFFMAALMGLLMRYAFVGELTWMPPYRQVLLAHSHVVMLGWVSQTILVLLVLVYLGEEALSRRFYLTLIALHQSSIVIMLTGFLMQGYGPVSIAGTTLQGLLSYAFIYRFYRDIRTKFRPKELVWAYGALIFQFIALLGIWMVACIMVFGGGKSALYYESVQFYLHYMINGWFTFAVLAIVVRWLPYSIPELLGKAWIWLVLSCLLTFALAITWASPKPWIFWINSLGVLLQLVALYFLVRWFRRGMPAWKQQLSKVTYLLLILIFLALFLKIVIQTAVIVPVIAKVAYTIRNFVIGFLHLIFLAFMSLFLLAYATQREWLDSGHWSLRWGLGIFIGGILSTELLLFGQGIMQWAAWGFMPHFYEWLFVSSGLLPLGIGIILANYWLRQVKPTQSGEI